MGANVAGIYGAQIFRSDDRPLYSRGFSIAISVLCVGLILAIIRWIDDTVRRRRNARQTDLTPSKNNSSCAVESNESRDGGLSTAVPDTATEVDTSRQVGD
ncbi:hypothetical protein TruAng_009998 [Truncatella angustata]|nr:hypothetical protein TruAng_009998 [Truncatella angustata]